MQIGTIDPVYHLTSVSLSYALTTKFLPLAYTLLHLSYAHLPVLMRKLWTVLGAALGMMDWLCWCPCVAAALVTASLG